MPNQKQTWALLSATATAEAPGPAPFPNTYSLDFDGVDEYLKTSAPFSALDGGTALSISAWIKPTDVATIDVVLHNPKNTTNGNSQFFLWLLKGNRINFSMGTESYYLRGDIASINYGAWNHILITWDSSISPTSDRGKMYVNGADVTTSFNGGSPTTLDSAIDGLYIGETNNGYYDSFTGNIDEVSVFSTALGADDRTLITAAPIDLKTALSVTPEIWYRSGDSSKALYFNSIWQIPNEIKVDNFSNYSFDFDGIDDRVQIGPATTSLGISGAITISFWCKMPSGSTTIGPAPIGEDSTSGSTRNWGFICVYNSLIFQVWNTDGTGTNCTSPSDSQIQDGEWHHVMGTFDGTSDMVLFIDGSSVATATTGSTGTRTSGQSPYIGGVGSSGTSYNWTGEIDDVAIFDADKSGSIATIYNSGVPTDLSADSDLVAYFLMGEGATFIDLPAPLPDSWSIPDEIGSSNGTTSGMDIADRVTDAPDNTSQANSVNMEEDSRVEDTP